MTLGSLWRDTRGVTLVHAMLTMPIMMIVLGAMVEFGVAMFQWNQAVKAAQIGARLAVVSSPIVGDTRYYDEMTADYDTEGKDDGDPVPTGVVTVACGPGMTACDSGRLNRLLTGGDGSCVATSTPRNVGMCDVAPYIGANNVIVSYQRSGLGYVGRPLGPVSTVTIELTGLVFDFLILDSLIPGLDSISIPAHPVAMTSEDLNDCRDTCP